jgi:hypothetical protein
MIMLRRIASPATALITPSLVSAALIATALIAAASVAATLVASTLVASTLAPVASTLAPVASTRCLATFAADLGHVLTILTHSLATFAAGFASFLGIELMGSTLLMSGLSTLAGDLTLLLFIHPGESAATVATISLRLSHDVVPQSIVIRSARY